VSSSKPFTNLDTDMILIIIPVVLVGYILLHMAGVLLAALFWVLAALVVCAIIIVGIGYMLTDACANGDDIQR
jgi:hypothetical protein